MTTETTPTPNIPLLRKVVELAEAEVAGQDERAIRGGKWNQAHWARTSRNADTEDFHGHRVLTEKETCNTTGCIAGHAVMLSGDQLIFDGVADLDRCVDPEGKSHQIPDRAEELLGLNTNQSVALFCATNTITTVRAVAENIAASVGDRL